MTGDDTFIELTKVIVQQPRRGDVPDDVLDEVIESVQDERSNLAETMRTQAQESERYEYDPVLSAIREAKRRQDRAEAEIRRLIAYAREFTMPRTYRLTDLAEAAGMSISGVRTAYDDDEIDEVGEAIGSPPRSTKHQAHAYNDRPR